MTGAFTVLFSVSGLLLWYGERDTRFRFAGTILLHDGLMYVSLLLLVGHLYLVFIRPATRHSLRGMTTGYVRVDWARRRHPRWVDSDRDPCKAGEPRREPHQLTAREQDTEGDEQRAGTANATPASAGVATPPTWRGSPSRRPASSRRGSRSSVSTAPTEPRDSDSQPRGKSGSVIESPASPWSWL